jgi:hypothetical protein
MIMQFPSKQEEREVEEFRARINAEYAPRAEYYRQCFEANRREGTRMSVDMALRVQRVGFDYLELLFAGLPPKQREEFADALVPWWIKYKATRARVLELAQRALAEMETRSA